MTPRTLVARLVPLTALVALAACGGDDQATPPDGISVVDSTTSLAPPTTTVATSVAGEGTTTVPATAAPTTTAPATTVPATEPPTTPAPADTAAPSGLYRLVTPPTAATTDPIDPAWVEASGETLGTDVADGVYWGVLVGPFEGAGGSGLSFDLSQVFFGEDCTAQFGTGDDACLNDYGVLETPHGELPAYVDSLQYVSVADVIDNEASYLIDGAELFRMASGNPPSAGAPEYWALAPFPYLVTVRGGTVISLEQVWLP